MKLQHIGRLFLAIALITMMLVSCGGGGGETTTESTESTTTASEATTAASTAIQMSSLTLVKDGKSDFVIYRTKSLGDESLQAVQELVNAINAETGVKIKIVNDWGDAGEKDTDDAPAILIGRTSFAADELLAGLRLTQYIASISGNKLVIGGQDDETTAKAIRRFIKDCVKGKGDTLTFSPEQVFFEAGDYELDTSYLLCLGEPIENYRIVIPADADYAVERCAAAISAHLSKVTGMLYPIVTDAEATDSGAYEILIGKTTRTTVEPAAYAYDISAKGKALQIVAGSWYGYEEATKVFKADVVPIRRPLPITEETWRRDDLSGDLKQTSPSLQERSGDVRVLIHNIWGNTSEGKGDLRMIQTAMLYESYAPDIIGLQECSPTARSGQTSIIKLLSAQGYTEVPASAENSKKNNYTPLLYRKDKFELLESGHVLFDGQNDSGSKGVTYGVFKVKDSGKTFAVLSTHFWWKSEKTQDTLDRESNARQILQKVADIETKYACPVIVGGDFNCNPASSPYGVLTKGSLRDIQSWAKRAENLRTNHSYPTYNEKVGIWADPVNPSGGYDKSIDHVFAKGNITPECFDIVTDLYALLSSDHCPMVCDFTLK